MTTNKRQTLVDFMFYSLCEGQQKAGAYGYSPLPLNLVQAGFEQLGKLGAADPEVDVTNRDATQCRNPTFVAGDLSRNHLAEIAAAPAACDQQGQGPCTDGGAGGGGTDGGTGTGSTGGSGGGAGGGSGAGGGTDVATDTTGTGGDLGLGTQVDPATGEVISTGVTGSASSAVTTALPPRPLGHSLALGLAAAAELLAVVLIPGLLIVRHRRARATAARLTPRDVR